MPRARRYLDEMAKRKSRAPIGEILSKNLKALMDHHVELKSNNRLGDAAGIPPRTVGRIINQEHMPQIDTLDKLAAVFEIESWCLLLPEFDPKNPAIRAMTEAESKLYSDLKTAIKAVEATP